MLGSSASVLISWSLIPHPLFWYWYRCSYFRKGRQAKFWQTLLRAGKIPKNIFKNLEKYWWDLKKGGSYSNLGRKNPRKNTENPEQSWKFREGLTIWKKILKWVPKKLLIQKNIDWIFQKYLVWKYIKEKIWKKWQKIGEEHLKNSGVEQVWNILWGEMESAAKLQSGASCNLAGQRGMEI